MLKHGILGLLNYCDMTGYEIAQTFKISLDFFWKAQTSQIYRELQALEKNQWVGKTLVHQQGRPDKNVYFVTDQGRGELLRWLCQGGLEFGPRNPMLMKVFFMGEQSREENIRCFQELQERCRAFLEGLGPVADYIETYSACLNDREQALYWNMTVEYGRKNMQMCMEWAKECIARLEGRAV